MKLADFYGVMLAKYKSFAVIASVSFMNKEIAGALHMSTWLSACLLVL